METVSDNDIAYMALECKLSNSDFSKLYNELEIKPSDVRNIEKESGLHETGMFYTPTLAILVLQFWQYSNGSKATRKVLLDALDQCGMSQAKEKLEEKWGIVSQDTKVTLSNIVFHEQLGEGGYGTVYRVTFKKPFKGYTEAAAKSVLTLRREEVDIMRQLHHPNIVTLLGFHTNVPNNTIILLEYAKHGSLHDYLTDQSKPLPDDLKCKWMTEAASAIEHLHTLNFLHRDIKPKNCLLFANDTLKLCDFGLARVIQHSQSSSTLRGTYRYMAPEIHIGNERGNAVYSKPGDLYAYGMVILEIITREQPFVGIEWQKLVFGVCNGEQPTIPDSCPKLLADLMRQCWSMDLKERPTIQDVLKVLSLWKSDEQTIASDSIQANNESSNEGPKKGTKNMYTDPVEFKNILENLQQIWIEQQVSQSQVVKYLEDNCRKLNVAFHGRTPADGNCFFSAVSDQLNLLNLPHQSPSGLRQSVVEFLRRNPTVQTEDGAIDFQEIQPDWEKYCTAMARDGEWADHIVVTATAHLLRRDIIIVTSSPQGAERSDPSVRIPGTSDGNVQPLLLGHVWEFHYQSLRRVEAEPVCDVTIKDDFGEESVFTPHVKKSTSSSAEIQTDLQALSLSKAEPGCDVTNKDEFGEESVFTPHVKKYTSSSAEIQTDLQALSLSKAEPVCVVTIKDDFGEENVFTPHVKKSTSSSAEIQTNLQALSLSNVKKWKLARIIMPEQHGKLLRAHRVVSCPNGNMIVADGISRRLYLLDANGKYKMTLARPVSDPKGNPDPSYSELDIVTGLAVSSQGYVAAISFGMSLRFVCVYDSDGNYHSCFPIWPPDMSGGHIPVDVTIDRDGLILVGTKDDLYTFSPEGELVRRIKWKGAGNSDNIRVNKRNQILYNTIVSHASSYFQDYYIVAIDYAGNEIFNFKPTIDEKKKGTNRFFIGGLECDEDDNIYIVIYVIKQFKRVHNTGHLHQYSPTGEFMRCIDRGIKDPWELKFAYDGSLVIANADSLLVYHKEGSHQELL